MTKYLIKLRPLDTFFFSQENKYRRKLKNKKYQIEADYFQKSAYFPQQTTVFGALRYYVLQKNGQIPITDEDFAKQLIGDRSFDVGNSKPDFGNIKNISTVFICDENDNFYFQNPKDAILIKDNKNKEKIDYLRKKDASFKTNLSNNMLIFENYIEKDGISTFLFNSGEKFLPFEYNPEYEKDIDGNSNGIFIKNERIGITKKERGGTDDNAFYKQVFFSLMKGYSFGIIAELDNMDEHTGLVVMGAEKSTFSISFKKIDASVEEKIFIEKVNSPKIVLLSDAYLSNYDNNEFRHAISDTKTFRFLKTEVKKNKTYYSSDPLKKEFIKRSVKYSLLERGSVFYFENESDMNRFSEKLNNEINFKQIGYNQHKKIN